MYGHVDCCPDMDTSGWCDCGYHRYGGKHLTTCLHGGDPDYTNTDRPCNCGFNYYWIDPPKKEDRLDEVNRVVVSIDSRLTGVQSEMAGLRSEVAKLQSEMVEIKSLITDFIGIFKMTNTTNHQ